MCSLPKIRRYVFGGIIVSVKDNDLPPLLVKNYYDKIPDQARDDKTAKLSDISFIEDEDSKA